jgi:lysozyme
MNADAVKILAVLISKFEGIELKAYLCPAKVWTIGYGHTKGVKQGDIVSIAQANEMLMQDMQEYWEGALKLSPNLVNASPERQAAIVDFCYNCGIGNYEKSSLRKLVNSGQWQAASGSILQWNKARVNGVLKVLNGLTKRRIEESKLLYKK